MLNDYEIIEEKEGGLALIENLKTGKFTVLEIDREMHNQVKTKCKSGGCDFAPISDSGISYISRWVSEDEAREYFDTDRTV